MPPTSNIRKTSLASSNVVDAHAVTSVPRRTTSGRAIRAHTTRPANYYARPFGAVNTAAASNVENDASAASPPGFFPAIQYFSDAITALPKEVMRQFTLMKEVEAKIHGAQEQLGEMVDKLMELPTPARKTVSGPASGPQGLMSLTTHNSVSGSTTASLMNGATGRLSVQNSIAGSQVGEEVQADGDEDLARRKQYHELRLLLSRNLLQNLDEKNAVLTEANRVMGLQMMRVDSVMPHIENEISEEARLGSMTHWAYSDNRQKKQAPLGAARGRDLVAANNLAAAASAMRDAEIAQARRDAVRETNKETNKERHKGKRQQEAGDSEFDDKPRKTAKVGKSKAAVNGLGMSNNAEPVKKRKIEKTLAAPAMERTVSSKSKGVRETPRSTPAEEQTKKTKKAKPGPTQANKRPASSPHLSPAVASSPSAAIPNASGMEPPLPGARPQSGRLRQNSTTNLRHAANVDDEATSRPASVRSGMNGNKEKGNGKHQARDEEAQPAVEAEAEAMDKILDGAKSVKREDADLADSDRPGLSRSASNSGKAGRGSKTGTPRTENFPADVSMVRTRSTRSTRNNGGHDSSSSEPPVQGAGGRHKRAVSNSHLVKQIAPYNKSPERDRLLKDDVNEEVESVSGRQNDADEQAKSEDEQLRRSSRPVSRRNTQTTIAPSSPPAADPVAEDREDTAMGDEDEEMEQEEEEEEEVEERELEEDGEDGDDAEEAGEEEKYCYCNQSSYGDMVACDNKQCPREWFHLGCTELTEPPEPNDVWYCEECRPKFAGKKRRLAGSNR